MPANKIDKSKENQNQANLSFLNSNAHPLTCLEFTSQSDEPQNTQSQNKKSLISWVKEISSKQSSKWISDYFQPASNLNQSNHLQKGKCESSSRNSLNESENSSEAASVPLNILKPKKTNSFKQQSEKYDSLSAEGITTWEPEKNDDDANQFRNLDFIKEANDFEEGSEDVSFTLEIEKEDDRQPFALISPHIITQKVVPAPSICTSKQGQGGLILVDDSDHEVKKKATQRKQSKGKRGKKSKKAKNREESTKTSIPQSK